MLIYVEEPAVQGGRLQPHPDRLAERHRARPPGRSYRREALLAPAPDPGLEMTAERLECGFGRDAPQTLFGTRCRWELGARWRGGKIDPDADNDKLGTLAQTRLRLRAGFRRACYRRPARHSAICRKALRAARRSSQGCRRRPTPLRNRAALPGLGDNAAARSAKRRDCRAATPRRVRAAPGQPSARAPTPMYLLPRH